jgi:hypothetical protein
MDAVDSVKVESTLEELGKVDESRSGHTDGDLEQQSVQYSPEAPQIPQRVAREGPPRSSMDAIDVLCNHDDLPLAAIPRLPSEHSGSSSSQLHNVSPPKTPTRRVLKDDWSEPASHRKAPRHQDVPPPGHAESSQPQPHDSADGARECGAPGQASAMPASPGAGLSPASREPPRLSTGPPRDSTRPAQRPWTATLRARRQGRGAPAQPWARSRSPGPGGLPLVAAAAPPLERTSAAGSQTPDSR